MKYQLMTYEEYARIENESPYLFTITKHGQSVWYFGAYHTFDPVDKQFKMLSVFWDKFIAELGGETHRAVSLVEGGVRRVAENEKEAITRDGEAGFISFLAAKHSIPLESPEPPLSHEFQELLRTFKKEEIYYYYFARIVSQWNRMSTKSDFAAYVNKYLAQEADEGHWSPSEYSLSALREIHKKLFGNEFNPEDKKFFQDIVNPMEHIAVTNKVAQESGRIRDLFIVNEIIRHWDSGQDIFIVYGDAHAVMQEQLLKDTLK